MVEVRKVNSPTVVTGNNLGLAIKGIQTLQVKIVDRMTMDLRLDFK
jgi:hypothetical protein